MRGNLKLFELKKLEDTRMKIVIINGSARNPFKYIKTIENNWSTVIKGQ